MHTLGDIHAQGGQADDSELALRIDLPRTIYSLLIEKGIFSFLIAVSAGHRNEEASRGQQGYHSNIDSFLIFPRPAV